jgi:hypothetical protein
MANITERGMLMATTRVGLTSFRNRARMIIASTAPTIMLERMESMMALRVSPARFLLPEEQVEDGDADGGHGEAQGCSERRRWSASERLGFRFGEFFYREREELGPVLVTELL